MTRRATRVVDQRGQLGDQVRCLGSNTCEQFSLWVQVSPIVYGQLGSDDPGSNKLWAFVIPDWLPRGAPQGSDYRLASRVGWISSTPL